MFRAVAIREAFGAELALAADTPQPGTTFFVEETLGRRLADLEIANRSWRTVVVAVTLGRWHEDAATLQAELPGRAVFVSATAVGDHATVVDAEVFRKWTVTAELAERLCYATPGQTPPIARTIIFTLDRLAEAAIASLRGSAVLVDAALG